MVDFSFCLECGRRLRDAIFCPYCGASACSWDCYGRHYGAKHRLTPSYSESPFSSEPNPAGVSANNHLADTHD